MRESGDTCPQELTRGRTTRGIVRIGGMVHRPKEEHRPFVRDLLIHLEAAGFTGAPRHRGFDEDGREVLTFLAGEVPHRMEPGGWTDEQLRRAAILLRELHNATAGGALAGGEEVVCHNDFAPWNTVFVAGFPAGVIDFDDARPGPRIRDVSYALWCWLALGTARGTAQEQARRIDLMCEAYGLRDRSGLAAQIAERQQEIFAQHGRNGWVDQARQVAAEIEWLKANEVHLFGGIQ